MWPHEHSRSVEILRVGRHALERWAGAPQALSLVARCALPKNTTSSTQPDPDSLADVLRALYDDPPSVKVTVLLESAWLPLLVVDVGQELWTSAQVEPLLRHRLQVLDGEGTPTSEPWDLRLDYRAGERWALGYGLAPRFKQTLMDEGSATGLQWDALIPAFAWGLQRLRPARHWPGRTGWCVWPEQDRTLLAHLVNGRVVALNTAGINTDDPHKIVHMVEVEGRRSGVGVRSEPITVATWAVTPKLSLATNRLRWIPIVNPSRSRPPNSRLLTPSGEVA